MTARELTAALRRRLRRGEYWVVYAVSSLMYTSYVWMQANPVRERVAGIVTGHLFFFAIMWLAPLPWQWSGSPGGRRGPWRAGIQAFIGVEIITLVWTLIDDLMYSFPRGPALVGHVYLAQLCFQGMILFLAGNVLAHREREEAEKLVMGRAATEARTQALQGQLHPHVLFNALNALAELYREEPQVAEVHLRSMSDLLRQVLQASERKTQPLSQERLLVERYLLMESVRLGPRIRVTWAWERALDAVPVLPLLLQPLVENALKHGISPAKQGGELVVASAWDGDTLTLQVRNTGLELGPTTTSLSGVGLRNLRERLALAYGASASFDLRREGDWTLAEVRIRPSDLSPFMREESGGSPSLLLPEAI